MIPNDTYSLIDTPGHGHAMRLHPSTIVLLRAGDHDARVLRRTLVVEAQLFADITRAPIPIVGGMLGEELLETVWPRAVVMRMNPRKETTT